MAKDVGVEGGLMGTREKAPVTNKGNASELDKMIKPEKPAQDAEPDEKPPPPEPARKG